MNKLAALLFLTLLVGSTPLAGEIYMGAPVVSGEVFVSPNDRGTERINLSPEQLQAMAGWLEQGRSGWNGEYIEASPNEIVELKIKLKHADEGVTSISVMAGRRGGHFVRITGPGTWAYRAWGGFFKTWAAMRQISDNDLATLHDLIGLSR